MSSEFIWTRPASWGLFRWLYRCCAFKGISYGSFIPRMMVSEHVTYFPETFESAPPFPAKTRGSGMIENNIDTLDSPSLWLPINMQMCFPRNCWRGYGHSFSSLPILIWQVKWRPSGGPAPVIEKLGPDQGLYWCCRLAVLRIAQVILKAVVIVK